MATNDSIYKNVFLKQGTRRRASNFLLQPKVQLKLPFYVLLLTTAFAILMGIVVYQGFAGLYEFVVLQGVIGEQMGQVIQYQIHSVLTVSASILAAFVLLTIALSVIYLHKLVGPTLAFKRHIDALKKGRYSSRVNLREDDAFRDIADELNELAEVMEKKRGNQPISE